MSELHDSINKILLHKQSRQQLNGQRRFVPRSRASPHLTWRYFKFLLYKLIAKLLTPRYLKAIVVCVLLLVLVLKNKVNIYYGTWNLVDPIPTVSHIKFVTSGLAACFGPLKIFEHEVGNKKLTQKDMFKYSKQKSINLEPQFSVTKFVNMYEQSNSTQVLNTPDLFIGAILEENERLITNFKTIFDKVNWLPYDHSKISFSIMIYREDESKLEKDAQKAQKEHETKNADIEAFLENYFKTHKEDRVPFHSVTVFDLQQPLKAMKNVLVNYCLEHESKLAFILNQSFKPSVLMQTLNSTALEKRVFVNKAEDKTTFNFVTMDSNLFKMGVQFSTVDVAFNSWEFQKPADTIEKEVEGLCYKAQALGSYCYELEKIERAKSGKKKVKSG